MAQEYSREDPSFEFQRKDRRDAWFCDTCGETRGKHTILIIEDRRDQQESPDRVIAICPDGQTIGATERLLEMAGVRIVKDTAA
ncbi:MAG: hypothetical protein OXE17_00065 [Chloroflexi bacterium]|nr:hypothetical protein [Chloroflexota bacterium]